MFIQNNQHAINVETILFSFNKIFFVKLYQPNYKLNFCVRRSTKQLMMQFHELLTNIGFDEEIQNSYSNLTPLRQTIPFVVSDPAMSKNLIWKDQVAHSADLQRRLIQIFANFVDSFLISGIFCRKHFNTDFI